MIGWPALSAVFKRDLLLGWRGIGDMMAGLMFFAIIIALVPLAIGPDPIALQQVGPAVIWIGALIATLPQMEKLFTRDAAEGALDHLLMTPAPLPLLVLSKVIAAWILIGLPLTIFAPVLGMMLGLSSTGLGMMMLSLALGSLALLLIGTLAASLVLGARRTGVLMAILVLPLAMPILIFGTAISQSALAGDAVGEPLKLLGGITLIFLAITPPLTAMSLRYAQE